MEASALPASVGLARPRLAFGASLLRIRSDDQLVSLFRGGNEDAFRVIHDRYRGRLHAYTRQMLIGSPHDCEDALQEVFVRAYFGLRTNRRDLALRPWLYRVAHNRCVDELRRPPLAVVEPDENLPSDALDPADRIEQRDALRQLISDVRRLPDQQRSALLMRELSGMSYQEVADALGVSVAAVKSLLVRARVGLAQATEARDTSCAQIREELILAHDRKVRASGLARRHLSECDDCRRFRAEMRGVSRQLAALTPTLGPLGVVANLLGFGGGGAALGGSTAAAGSVGAGAAASAGLFASGHVVTLLAAAVVTAGGAVELQKTIIAPPAHHARHHIRPRRDADPSATPGPVTQALAGAAETPAANASPVMLAAATMSAAHSAPADQPAQSVPLTQILDPDHLAFIPTNLGSNSNQTGPAGTAGSGASSSPPAASAPSPAPILPPATTSSPSSVPGSGVPSSSSSSTAGSSQSASGTASAAPASSSGASSGSQPAASGTDSAAGASGTGSATAAGSDGSTPSTASTGSTGSTGTSSSGTSASSTRPSTGAAPAAGTNTPVSTRTLSRTSTGVARTVAAGGATGGHVITFLVTRRHARSHARSHGFTLGTLLPR